MEVDPFGHGDFGLDEAGEEADEGQDQHDYDLDFYGESYEDPWERGDLGLDDSGDGGPMWHDGDAGGSPVCDPDPSLASEDEEQVLVREEAQGSMMAINLYGHG